MGNVALGFTFLALQFATGAPLDEALLHLGDAHRPGVRHEFFEGTHRLATQKAGHQRLQLEPTGGVD